MFCFIYNIRIAMKSIFSYMIPCRALPFTVYDIYTKKDLSVEWTIPLDQIIIHKSLKNVSAEKKIDVVLRSKTLSQNECFSKHVSPV